MDNEHTRPPNKTPDEMAEISGELMQMMRDRNMNVGDTVQMLALMLRGLDKMLYDALQEHLKNVKGSLPIPDRVIWDRRLKYFYDSDTMRSKSKKFTKEWYDRREQFPEPKPRDVPEGT
jgi:hypothetical protein